MQINESRSLICVKARQVRRVEHEAMHLGYDELVMDHIKHARNFRRLDGASRVGTGMNPLCGDELVVYLDMRDARIAEAAFQCTCCGISMASASIMTEMVTGRAESDATGLLRDFLTIIERREAAPDCVPREWLALLETVRRFPMRTRCATLPWITLESMLENCERAMELSG